MMRGVCGLDAFRVHHVFVRRWLIQFRSLFRSAGKDCVTRLLDKNERTRLGSRSGASEVKQHKWFAKINWGLLRNTQPPVSISYLTRARLEF